MLGGEFNVIASGSKDAGRRCAVFFIASGSKIFNTTEALLNL